MNIKYTATKKVEIWTYESTWAENVLLFCKTVSPPSAGFDVEARLLCNGKKSYEENPITFSKKKLYSLTNCNVYRPCWSEMSRLFWRPIQRPTVCPFESERCQGFPELHRKKKKNRWTLSHNTACQLFYYAKYCIYIDKTRRNRKERESIPCAKKDLGGFVDYLLPSKLSLLQLLVFITMQGRLDVCLYVSDTIY